MSHRKGRPCTLRCLSHNTFSGDLRQAQLFVVCGCHCSRLSRLCTKPLAFLPLKACPRGCNDRDGSSPARRDHCLVCPSYPGCVRKVVACVVGERFTRALSVCDGSFSGTTIVLWVTHLPLRPSLFPTVPMAVILALSVLLSVGAVARLLMGWNPIDRPADLWTVSLTVQLWGFFFKSARLHKPRGHTMSWYYYCWGWGQ